MALHIISIFVVVLAFIGWHACNYWCTSQPELSVRLEEWKQRGKIDQLQGRSIFYVDEAGNGPHGTLICLHGFPTSSYDWIKILPDLKNEFSRIILLDFLGFGFSEKPVNHTYTIQEQSHIVESLAMKENIKSAHILAHDYGDTVALELLGRHNVDWLQFKILSLTMLNGGIFPETHKPRLVQKLLLMPVVGYITSHLFNYPMFSFGFDEIFGVNKPTEEDDKDFWALLCYNHGYKATYKVINFLPERETFRTRWVGALVNAQIKVLMIYGPADPVNPPEFVSLFKKTVPKQTIISLDTEVGHYPQWEDPASTTREFLQFIKSQKAVPSQGIKV
ncbi:unnamed protein product [Lymnaea stagnalis]|uniref:AB hydrolase-1 domain-containing protein n=1 Tax=Lymnaea stagnalis TaxID=6523 RepID=A0AAV2I409_LYMST